MRIPLKSGLLSCFKRLSTAIYSCLLQKMVFVGVEKSYRLVISHIR